MRNPLRWLAIFALATLACLSQSKAAFADTGTLSETNCSGGGFTFTATTITWLPAGTVPGTGCIVTGLGTNVTYSGGTLGAGVQGNIKNLAAGGGSVDDFMTFSGTTLDFVLTELGPGVASTVCTGLTIGGSCSIFPGSPFVLTDLGTSTAISMNALGQVLDGGNTGTWSGAFSAIVNLTPLQIQTIILSPDGSVSSTQSGSFTVNLTDDSVPAAEASTSGLLLVGLGSLLLFVTRRQKAESV